MSRSVSMKDVVRLEQQSINEAAELCIRNMLREELHVTALTVLSLPDCDGMTEEFLLNQPPHLVGEYLEEITKEVVA